MPDARRSFAQRGFSMVELSVAMAVVALMTWAVSSAMGNAVPARERERAVQTGETLRGQLRAFALGQTRLPCPDTDGDGWEGDATGACGVTQVGWLPYRTLGLDLPQESLRATYAVYRAPHATATADADLAVRRERTGDAVGHATHQDVHDLIAALNTAAAQTATPVMNRAVTTGDGGLLGAVDCTATANASNPAYWLVFPLEDRSGDGQRLDGVHTPTSVCAQAPGTPHAATLDDVVVAEAFSVLAGWLHARAP